MTTPIIPLVDLCPGDYGGFRRHTVEKAGEHHGSKLPDGSTQWGGFDVDCLARVETLAEAQGIWFNCPIHHAQGKLCGIVIWFEGRGVPDHMGFDSTGKKVRWTVVGGTGLHDLQLSPSILTNFGIDENKQPVIWHGFVGINGAHPVT